MRSGRQQTRRANCLLLLAHDSLMKRELTYLPNRKYKENLTEDEALLFFLLVTPWLPAPPWQWLIGGTQVSWRDRWCVYAGEEGGRLKAKRSLADCRDVHHQTEKWGFGLCFGQIALALFFFCSTHSSIWWNNFFYYYHYYYYIIGV